MDKILEMDKISKSFPGVQALDAVDFEVHRGEIHCLIGANGAGKSTLMKILSGVYEKDGGDIYFDGKKVHITSPLVSKQLGIATIYQELSLIEELSVAENIFLGTYFSSNFGIVSWRRMYREAQKIVDQLSVDIDVTSPVSQLSMGHKQIVELAKALASRAQIIIMDEPSTTLSERELHTLFNVIADLKKRKITIIYISHKLEELFTVGDRVTVLRNGQLVGTRKLSEINQNELIEMITGRKLGSQNIFPQKSPVTETVLEGKNLTNHKLKNVSFTLGKGEILGIYGLVGSGRSELLKSLFGIDSLDSGEIYINGCLQRIKSPDQAISLGFGLTPENRKVEGIIPDLSITENAVLPSHLFYSRFGILQLKGIHQVMSEKVEELNIKTPSIYTPINNLSGGNQQKVIFAKWLIRNSQILLLDEPTQGIDIGAKEEIYSIIRQVAKEGKSIIVVSSEINEIVTLCHRVLVMFRGSVVNEFVDPVNSKDEILHAAVMGGEHWEEKDPSLSQS